jgi:hypothetical protein
VIQKAHILNLLMQLCDLAYVGSGEETAVTGSADRIVRFWDLSRRQANLVCNLKTNSYIGAGKLTAIFVVAAALPAGGGIGQLAILIC